MCSKESAGNEEKIDNLPAISGFPVVGTNQTTFYDHSGEITASASGEAFFWAKWTLPWSTAIIHR